MWKKKSSDTRVLVDLGLCVLGCGFVPIMDSSSFSFSFSYSSFGYGFVLTMGSSSGYGFVLAVSSPSSYVFFLFFYWVLLTLYAL